MYWLTGVLGVLMMIAPWALQFSDNTTALWTSIALGAVLFVLAAMEAYQQGEVMWEYWGTALVGLLAIVAPFVLGFSTETVAFWTMIILGGLALTRLATGSSPIDRCSRNKFDCDQGQEVLWDANASGGTL